MSNMNDKPVKKAIAFLAIAAFTTVSGVSIEIDQPQFPLLIRSIDLPQYVEQKQQNITNERTNETVCLYHNLKEKLNISHTEFGKWLGLKRRSLYNWIDNPESSSKSEEIEERLVNLSKLVKQMEPEHMGLTYKIAFSPLYGDKGFGVSILNGSSDEVLLEWYDQLFDKFEAYRKNTASS